MNTHEVQGKEGIPGPGAHEVVGLLACDLPSSSPPPWDHPTAPSPLSPPHSAPKECGMHDTTCAAVLSYCCQPRCHWLVLQQACLCLDLAGHGIAGLAMQVLHVAAAMVLLLCTGFMMKLVWLSRADSSS